MGFRRESLAVWHARSSVGVLRRGAYSAAFFDLFREELVLWADRDPKKCATLGAFIEWDEDCLSTGAGAADVSWG